MFPSFRRVTANGEVITEMRQTFGMSQEQLALVSRCSSLKVQRAEDGKRVDVDSLRRIAASLGVPFGSLTILERRRL